MIISRYEIRCWQDCWIAYIGFVIEIMFATMICHLHLFLWILKRLKILATIPTVKRKVIWKYLALRILILISCTRIVIIFIWEHELTICHNGELVSLGQSIFEILKLNRKQKLFRTPGFFLDFFPQHILATGSRHMPSMWPCDQVLVQTWDFKIE